VADVTAQSRRVLWSQVGDVLADLPLFLTAPLDRRGHLRWGATPDEVIAVMPGDDRFPEASFRATRAISVAARPELVWPWLVQVECLRAGWWQLTPTSDGGTRLVNRIHAVYDWSRPFDASLGVVLMEFGDFAMNRRMMRGIKARAESLAGERERV
jgi:hypothetical protein